MVDIQLTDLELQQPVEKHRSIDAPNKVQTEIREQFK
jgi:hypothetical protein